VRLAIPRRKGNKERRFAVKGKLRARKVARETIKEKVKGFGQTARKGNQKGTSELSILGKCFHHACRLMI